MRRKLPIFILAIVFLLQAFVPAVYASSENKAISSSVYLCPFDPTPEGAGKTGVIEQHHLLPQQFKKQFEKAGLDIEKYKIPLDKADHRLKPDGLHTGANNWNKQWDDFFKQNPNARQDQILNQLDKMKKASGLK